MTIVGGSCWWQLLGGKRRAGGGGGGRDTTLKTKTPHVNVGILSHSPAGLRTDTSFTELF